MEENNKMNRKEMECVAKDQIQFGAEWGSLVRLCEHGNKLSYSIKDRGFLDQLSDYQYLQNAAVQDVSNV